MRKILFKGKRTDNGGWIYGSPIFQDGYVLIRFWNSEEFKFEEHLVAPESVSEYTGLTDKNGTKIFEGDILKFSDCGIYPVWWDADFFTFGSCWFSDFDPLYKYDRNKIEVIGNIHDNPELLKDRERK